jgi:hypothetical protein
MLKPIAIATAIAGTLDILWAIILTLWFGRDPGTMLRFVASGPFPGATELGAGGAALGLLVHFTLMAIMAALFLLIALRVRGFVDHPVSWGVAYGLITYVAMNLVVVPLRFPAAWPPKPLSIATQLFAHIILVGIPMALPFARWLKSRAKAGATNTVANASQ